MDNFIRKNVNPKSRKATDCVIRAIVSATGLSWEYVYDWLSAYGRKKYLMPNDDKCWTALLESLGFKKQKVVVTAGSKRPTVVDLARTLDRPAVVQVANHLTAIDGEGHYIDTWDCGYKCSYGYWTKY